MAKVDYKLRRQRLMQTMLPGSVAILAAAPEFYRTGDTMFSYRQNSDFHYLTGLNEPDAVAVFIPNRKEGEFILFNRSRDPARELWDGGRAGQEGACATYQADQAFPIEKVSTLLPELLVNRDHVYYNIGKDAHFDRQLMQWLNSVRRKIRSGINAPTSLIALDTILHEMRLIKDDAEIATMRKANEISVGAHRKAMQVCRPGMMEYEIEAELRYEFIRNGCQSTAYSSIVGGGKNGCILHYTTNDQKLNAGELLLIDAGCEYQYYASDITRTFPINGKYTAEQKAVYDIVLAAQLAALEIMQPGLPWIKMQETVVRVITQGLIDVGILRGNIDDLIEKRAYYDFYMHYPSHWLGLDTHDVGSYQVNGEWRKLAPGMVLTMEPGIYISGNNPNVDPKWWNIGVRIEDDVLITKEGNDILTKNLPKTTADIEALMAG